LEDRDFSAVLDDATTYFHSPAACPAKDAESMLVAGVRVRRLSPTVIVV
jgi:hypothetical protein